MNKNQELVTLLRENGQRLRRSKEWCERNAHWIRRMNLTIADAPDSIAAELEKTLTPAPKIESNGKPETNTAEITDTPQSEESRKQELKKGWEELANAGLDKKLTSWDEDTKTETIEQIADDVAAKMIPDMTVEIKGGVPVKAIVKSDVSTTGTIDVIKEDNKLSLRDAAEYGGMTYNKLTKLVRKGEIKTVPGKTPKAKMILASEIDNYLSTQKQAT